MKKFLPYIIILVLITGFFSLAPKAQAQGTTPAPLGLCTNIPIIGTKPNISEANCKALATDGIEPTWKQNPASPSGSSSGIPTEPLGICSNTKNGDAPFTTTKKNCESPSYLGIWDGKAGAVTGPNPNPEENGLLDNLPTCWNLLKFDVGKCLIHVSYYVFYSIPASLLGLAALFFNAMLPIVLSSVMYSASFVGEAWHIIRDLSNIFFIIALLYIAIQTILGLSTHGGPKKMIAQVIIMALLINFSMFFTKVVIDSANILALVFYNKINVETKVAGKESLRFYSPYTSPIKTKIIEKDLSGGIVYSFDPTKLMSNDFFENAKKKTQRGSWVEAGAYVAGGTAIGGPVGAAVAGGAYLAKMVFVASEEVPDSLILTIIIVSGAIMLFAAYAFFIAGLSFLGRLIELWVLIIFSPFAFMSSTIPALSKIEGIGWESWFKKLLSSAFMAPIFMFFVYLIFLLVQIPILKDLSNPDQDTFQVMLFIIIQAIIILTLLMKATSYAKKSGGKAAEIIIGAGKAVAGLAVGGAFLGAASIGKGTIGAFMKGAATGDSANQRFARSQVPGAQNEMRGRWDTFKGGLGHYGTAGLLTRAQQATGVRVNADQTRVEQSAHSRHTLDEVAKNRYQGKTYEQLSGPERTWVQNRIDQDILTRNRAVLNTAAGVPIAYGNKQKFSELSDQEQAAITAHLNGMNPAQRAGIAHGSVQTTTEARMKQGIGSTIMQASRTGSYDARGLADLIMKEQSTGFAKIAMGLTGALAMGMRGGFKQMGVNYGTAQCNFFKDLGNTIGEALKSVNINVDLSKVGEEKKESGGGGGHH